MSRLRAAAWQRPLSWAWLLVCSQTGFRESRWSRPPHPRRGGRGPRRRVRQPSDSGPSAGGVAAQEGVEHGQLHPLLVPATPRHDRALAVGRVEVVAVARVRQADTQGTKIGQTHSRHIKSKNSARADGAPDDGFARLGKGDLSHWL